MNSSRQALSLRETRNRQHGLEWRQQHTMQRMTVVGNTSHELNKKCIGCNTAPSFFFLTQRKTIVICRQCAECKRAQSLAKKKATEFLIEPRKATDGAHAKAFFLLLFRCSVRPRIVPGPSMLAHGPWQLDGLWKKKPSLRQDHSEKLKKPTMLGEEASLNQPRQTGAEGAPA